MRSSNPDCRHAFSPLQAASSYLDFAPRAIALPIANPTTPTPPTTYAATFWPLDPDGGDEGGTVSDPGAPVDVEDEGAAVAVEGAGVVSGSAPLEDSLSSSTGIFNVKVFPSIAVKRCNQGFRRGPVASTE